MPECIQSLQALTCAKHLVHMTEHLVPVLYDLDLMLEDSLDRLEVPKKTDISAKKVMAI